MGKINLCENNVCRIWKNYSIIKKVNFIIQFDITPQITLSLIERWSSKE
jgi:hypothetical protein